MEPYKAGWPDHWKYAKIKDVIGKIVAISGLRKTERGLNIIYPRTRSLPKNEIVEISATDEKDAGPGNIVNSLTYIGFFEVEVGGQVVLGESVLIGEKYIGKIAGFSDIHCPNHLNIIIKSGQWFLDQINKPPIRSWASSSSSLYDLDISLNDGVTIRLKSR